MSDTNSLSGTWARKNIMVILLKRLRSRATTGTVADSVAWPNPSISGAHACIRLAHRDLIRLLCVPWRHKKPQRRACTDSLSTTVANPLRLSASYSSGRPRINANSPAHPLTVYTAHTQQFAKGLHFSDTNGFRTTRA